jgi:maltokinase-like protein
MAQIHNTTMSPTKLQLLTRWLPGQSWYAGGEPLLERSGGFRLDDPAGEVGIEFFVIADRSGGAVSRYLVPLTYRAAPLDGAEAALIGTGKHGVLGTRWVYDGVRDPVLVGALLALLQGETVAQDQGKSHTLSPLVQAHSQLKGLVVKGFSAEDVGGCTAIRVDAGATRLTVHVVRALHDGDGFGCAHVPNTSLGQVAATLTPPDGTSVTGELVVVALVD